MIRSIIVEDDPAYSDRLKKLLAESGAEISVFAVCKNVNEALLAVTEHAPELIFLDIELENGETGFDFLNRVSNVQFDVIFTTSHSEFMLRAIRMCALDFLPKPIIFEELIQAISKHVKRKKEKIETENLKLLIQNMNTTSEGTKQIMLADGSSHLRVEISNIIYGTSDNSSIDFFLAEPVFGKSKITSTESIGHFEKLLEPSGICRVHNRHLANISHIVKYNRGDGGSLIMSNRIELPVSKARKDHLLRQLKIR